VARFYPLGRILLVVLTPFWYVCFGFSLRSMVLEPTVFSAILLDWEADEYPIIRMFPPFVDVAAHGSQLGDRLIRVRDSDQRWTDPFSLFIALSNAEADGLTPDRV
jgi:hypothetical protein